MSFPILRPLGERGVVTIEFAALLPLLLLLFFGALETARVLVTAALVEKAGYEIAFNMRLSRGRAALETVTREVAAQKLSPMLNAGDLDVSAVSGATLNDLLETPASGPGEDGDTVRLSVTARIGFLSWLLPEGLTTERDFIYYYVNEAVFYTPAGSSD